MLDRYLLVRPIARGGMSLVYEAFDLEQIKPAAVKVLAPAFATNTRACHAARREPHLMQRMRHPTVPKVFAYGDIEAEDGATVPGVAMELLNGVPLTTRLAEGRMPWTQAVEIAASIAEMLAVAHRRGIAHRDLTADNVMLTTAGVKIIDFGLAVPYAHPSSVRTEHAPAWDVYALGVLLYHMLTGRSPHAPGARLLQAAPTPVVVVPGLPRSVAELCRQCMAKRPDERPDSAALALSLWAEFATDWHQPRALTESYGTRSGHGA